MFQVQLTAAGEWAVVAAGGRALLVAAPDRDRLLRLHAAVRTGFAETLDALVADGLSRTPAFALLDASAPAAPLLAVRGRASASVAEAGGDRAVQASAVSSWLETQLAGARSVRLGEGGGSGLPLADGVVWADGVTWLAEDAETEAAEEPLVTPVSRGSRETEPVEVLAPAEAEAEAEAEAAEVIIADPTIADPSLGEAIGAEPAAPDAPAPDAPAADAPAPDTPSSGYDHLFGATMVRSVEDAAVRPADAEAAADAPGRIDLPGFITDSFPPAASRAGDHDGLTVMSGDLPPRPEAPSAEPQPEPAAAPPASPRYELLLSDGRREDLGTAVVVGRAPSASAVPSLRGARPVTLTGAEDDISRSHVAVAVEGDSVVVTDLHSRNGTLIVLPGKAPQKLRSGEPTTVVAGTVIDLGSGATLTVATLTAEAGA